LLLIIEDSNISLSLSLAIYIYLFCQKDPIITIFFHQKDSNSTITIFFHQKNSTVTRHFFTKTSVLNLLKTISIAAVKNSSQNSEQRECQTQICFILYVPWRLYLDDNHIFFGAEIYDFWIVSHKDWGGGKIKPVRLAEHHLLTSSCSLSLRSRSTVPSQIWLSECLVCSLEWKDLAVECNQRIEPDMS
jgi:hypothetical protein